MFISKLPSGITLDQFTRKVIRDYLEGRKYWWSDDAIKFLEEIFSEQAHRLLLKKCLWQDFIANAPTPEILKEIQTRMKNGQ